MRRILRLVCVGAGAVLVGALSGCSTVLFSDNGAAERSAAVEREALIDAAAAVSRTKWPAPDDASWQSRIAHLGSEHVSKSDAVEVYLASLASLGEAGTRYDLVLADAGEHLKAADGLARAAANAANSVRPVMADVSIVEDAIGDLRYTRDIYVECLKTLAKEGEPAPAGNVRALKSQFDDAIKALGDVADELADRVADDRTETFAGPPQRDRLNGSL